MVTTNNQYYRNNNGFMVGVFNIGNRIGRLCYNRQRLQCNQYLLLIAQGIIKTDTKR